ncbi:hypothetical protein UFOVP477_12 [uncultured Caudovirales phage]|uniref:Uncharacterized protein n=1 Tax=uncultured Caudovirales phage TaxID=2100421 RepID=A0A6J5MIJ3_9CAUD|nr:hypothetical protein UFOVP477_12 [uncultured Caudovirales phage]CAB4163304.1 hypothetical protein UFOVP798_16 [uncultured Caudovirales phage]CAB4191541.1 hypothetical protein UFOVP1222_42 [uncultured Caudovirales phage]
MQFEHRVVRCWDEMNTARRERRRVLARRRRILADIHEPLATAVGGIDASEHREVVAVGEDDITASVLNREHGRGREGCLLLDE